jgi:hypothetical protein
MWNIDIDWTAVGGMAAAITGLVAIWTLAAARSDSRERTRPVVVAEYRIPARAVTKRLDLVIRNAGVSVARDVEVRFDPPLGSRPGDDLIRTSIRDRYKDRIAVLAPGQELTNVVEVDVNDPEASDVPVEMTVSVSYLRSRWRRYRDSYLLSAHVMAQHTYVTSSDSVEGSLKQIKVHLREVRDTLRSISRQMPEKH